MLYNILLSSKKVENSLHFSSHEPLQKIHDRAPCSDMTLTQIFNYCIFLERMFPLGIVVKEEIETDEVEGKQIYMKLGLFIT